MCTRWKNNGLPRKGWIVKDTEDMGDLIETCDWCGTDIRYVHWIYHEEIEQTTKCGIICAEALTEDYVTHRAKEKALKSLANKKIRKLKNIEKEKIRIEEEKIEEEKLQKYYKHNFKNSVKLSAKGNFYIKYNSNLVIFIKKQDKFIVCINNIWGKKIFNDLDSAMEAAYKYLRNY